MNLARPRDQKPEKNATSEEPIQESPQIPVQDLESEVKYAQRVRDTGYNKALAELSVPGTTIVRTQEEARRVIEILK